MDVLILAEYADSKEKLSDLFQRENIKLHAHGKFGCERIDVWSAYDDISPGKQEPYYSLQVIKDNSNNKALKSIYKRYCEDVIKRHKLPATLKEYVVASTNYIGN